MLSDDVLPALDASDAEEALVLLALDTDLLLVVLFFPHPLTLAAPSVMSRSMTAAFLFILEFSSILRRSRRVVNLILPYLSGKKKAGAPILEILMIFNHKIAWIALKCVCVLPKSMLACS